MNMIDGTHIDDSLGVVRTARKQWRCRCAREHRRDGTPNPDYRPDCVRDIRPGDQYFEYMGDAPAWGSGDRYCWPCAVAVWSDVGPGRPSLGRDHHTNAGF